MQKSVAAIIKCFADDVWSKVAPSAEFFKHLQVLFEISLSGQYLRV
jgi:hypothetical protein